MPLSGSTKIRNQIMPDTATIEGKVRVSSAPNYGEGRSRLGMTNRGERLTAIGVPSKTELTRLGDTWSLQLQDSNAAVPASTYPTTLAELGFYNGEPEDGKHYVINSAWLFAITHGDTSGHVTLIYQVVDGIAALTDDPNHLITGPLGHSYDGKAKRDNKITTMIANRWGSLASSPAAAAVCRGAGVVAEVKGGIILKPGATLGLTGFGTELGVAVIGVNWSEVQF